jgi:predicted ribosome quality control (RQC) complex YloA/Tae2 family protein
LSKPFTGTSLITIYGILSTMYFDALTLTAVADELRTTILGGRIQRALLPDPLSIGLEVYAHKQRYQLLATAHPAHARVHLIDGKLSRGVEQATPLLLLLRKYVLGGRITAIEQPLLERVLIVSIVKERQTRNSPEGGLPADSPKYAVDSANSASQDPDGMPDPDDDTEQDFTVVECTLIIEPMDRRSNIILVDENGMIMESVRRVPPQKSQRVILPKHPYAPPPPQEKHDPRTANADHIRQNWTADSKNIVRMLVQTYRGMSPLIAREVAYRAALPAEEPVDNEVLFSGAERLTASIRNLYTSPVVPTLLLGEQAGEQAGQVNQPLAYAPYTLTHRAGTSTHPERLSSAIDQYYAAQHTVTSHRQRRDTIHRQLQDAYERLDHQYRQLLVQQEHTHNLEQVKWEGEMIYAFLHTITPGQHTLEVEGQQIALDPRSTPVACAQKRFQDYQKRKSGQERVAERLQATRYQLDGLEQLLTMLELTEEREQIDQLAQEAEEQGYLPPQKRSKKKQKAPRIKPLHLVSSDGYDLYVGRSATQNVEVTFRIARPDDLWLHTQGVPGAHVIIRSGGRDVPPTTLEEAAGLAAYFSRNRHEDAVEVAVTRRSTVRRLPGGAPGLVTYQAEQTLRVAPRSPW